MQKAETWDSAAAPLSNSHRTPRNPHTSRNLIRHNDLNYVMVIGGVIGTLVGAVSLVSTLDGRTHSVTLAVTLHRPSSNEEGNTLEKFDSVVRLHCPGKGFVLLYLMGDKMCVPSKFRFVTVQVVYVNDDKSTCSDRCHPGFARSAAGLPDFLTRTVYCTSKSPRPNPQRSALQLQRSSPGFRVLFVSHLCVARRWVEKRSAALDSARR